MRSFRSVVEPENIRTAVVRQRPIVVRQRKTPEVNMVIEVCSDRVKYSEEFIESEYSYQTTFVKKDGASVKCFPQTKEFVFRTGRKVPKTCLALVGWGGKRTDFLCASNYM